MDRAIETLATPEEAARVSRFTADLAARGRRDATLCAYLSDWRKVSSWSAKSNGEPFDVARMVGREAAEFRAHEMTREQSPATINRALAFLVEYARWAVANAGVRAALATELRSVPRVPQQALAPKGLSRQDLRRFLKELDVKGSRRDRAVIYLMLFTGLRLGETTTLRIEDVELSERKGLVHLRSATSKGGKDRVVPVPATARRILSEYLDQRGREPGALFLGERGPLGRNGLTRVVGKYATAAGVKMSPHTLRHAYAYNFLRQTGNDLVALATLMGHSNLNTTMVYTRRRMEDLEAAVEGMDFA